MSAYPAQPWRLVGDLYVALVPVRRDAVAALLPGDHRLVGAAGWSVAAVVWAVYQPGGDLSYRELAVALPARRGWRLRATVPRIWVDSPASRDGGRELWAIPKELASFAVRAGTVEALVQDGRVASWSFRSRVRLPGRWPVRFALAQPDAGATRLVPVRGHGRVEVGRAVLRVSAGDGFPDLSRPRGVPAVGLRRFVLIFGERRWRRGAGRR